MAGSFFAYELKGAAGRLKTIVAVDATGAQGLPEEIVILGAENTHLLPRLRLVRRN